MKISTETSDKSQQRKDLPQGNTKSPKSLEIHLKTKLGGEGKGGCTHGSKFQRNLAYIHPPSQVKN